MEGGAGHASCTLSDTAFCNCSKIDERLFSPVRAEKHISPEMMHTVPTGLNPTFKSFQPLLLKVMSTFPVLVVFS